MSPKTADRTEEITDGAATNGHAEMPTPVQPASGPRAPRKVKAVRMPDEYGDAGMRVSLWTNVPSKLMDDALMASAPNPPASAELERRARALDDRERSGEDVADELRAFDEENAQRLQEYRDGLEEAKARRLKALHQIVVEHNGWCDWEGTPYPPATDDAFWDEIPDELAAAIMVLVRREAAKLPSSMMRTGRR